LGTEEFGSEMEPTPRKAGFSICTVSNIVRHPAAFIEYLRIGQRPENRPNEPMLKLGKPGSPDKIFASQPRLRDA